MTKHHSRLSPQISYLLQVKEFLFMVIYGEDLKPMGLVVPLFTFGPLGLYDPTSVIPNMPDPVIWKQGTYSGHISTQYLIQIRYICFPISTGWAGWPTLTGPFYYPTGWQPYLVSEPQEFLIYVDAGDRPDPPGPPGGGGQG